MIDYLSVMSFALKTVKGDRFVSIHSVCQSNSMFEGIQIVAHIPSLETSRAFLMRKFLKFSLLS